MTTTKEDAARQSAPVLTSAEGSPRSPQPDGAATPGPWLASNRMSRTHNHPERFWERHIHAADDLTLVGTASGASPDEAEANAELIVRAVNSHADLLAALKAVTEHMDRAGGDCDGMPECPWCRSGPDGEDHAANCELLMARAAVEKAEGRV